MVTGDSTVVEHLTHNLKIKGLSPVAHVRDMRLVVERNVFGTCSDKTDADRGITIINLMWKSG